MTTVWITGARGFIGRYLARSLSDQGNKVIGIGHGHWPAHDAEYWGVSSWLNSSVTANNLEVLRCKAERPNLIYHLAGGASVGASLESPRNDFSKTVDATSELLEWIRLESPSTTLVAVSSAAVYGSSHTKPIREVDTICPYSPYGYHKYFMEELCRSYGMHFGINAVVVRLFSVFGRQLKKQLLWDICCKLDETEGKVTLGGTGDELRDWIDVRDVVRALSLIADQADDQVPTFNFGTGIGTSVKDIAMMVTSAWSSAFEESRTIEFSGEARPGDPFSLVSDVSRINELGIRSNVRVTDGILDYVHWFASLVRNRS